MPATSCARTGFEFAIDDFGSGYAALSYLRDLPIDEVAGSGFHFSGVGRRAGGAVVRSSRGSRVILGPTVAEGGENAQAAATREYGCDVGQGYFFQPISGVRRSASVADLGRQRSVGVNVSDIELMQ